MLNAVLGLEDASVPVQGLAPVEAMVQQDVDGADVEIRARESFVEVRARLS